MDEGLPLPFTQRISPRGWVTLDVAFALLLGAGSIAGVTTGHEGPPGGTGWDAIRILAVLVACIALPFRRRHPVGALTVITPPVVLLAAVGVRGPVLTVSAFAMYSVAAGSPRRTSLTTVAAVAGGLAAGSLVAIGGPDWGGVLTGPAVVLVGWLAGENTRARRAYARGLADRAAERERERAERIGRAAADERVRIARELHDVVAHAVSVIAVRSGVARMVLDTQPEEAREALGIIENTSRQALQEMRLLVGVLRQEREPAAELGPAPGLRDLSALVQQIGEAGVRVDVHIEGEPRPLPAGIDVSAYRIIQEALTNVVRHAGPAAAELWVRYHHQEIEIEIRDDGGQREPDRAAAMVAAEGGGHGLVGMRERTALYGGGFVAGPAGDGFRVVARLPTDDPEQ